MAIISFKNIEDLEQALESQHYLGNTNLEWHRMEDKLCAICNNTNHLVKQCPIKERRAEKTQERKEQTKKFGHLYKRYKPVGVTAHIKFMETQQRFKGKTFAQVAKQSKPEKTTTNPVAYMNQQTTQPTLADVLQAINKLGEEIKAIKEKMTKMDDRIGYLEDDAYYYHESLEMEGELQANEDTRSGNNTPSSQLEEDNNHPLNYQRKRQATSPAVDIRHEQQAIYQRIEEMNNTVQSLTDTITQFTNFQEEESQSTISPNSNQ